MTVCQDYRVEAPILHLKFVLTCMMPMFLRGLASWTTFLTYCVWDELNKGIKVSTQTSFRISTQ
jgi:hypothetical protein